MPTASTEKRNPGFAKIRRGLLEHWPEMSSNAAKLYVWLHLRAYWSGPKRGCVEASFDDMARGNGWSLKTLQRTIEEIEAKPYIEVERATNQYKLTRVRILKYDLEESTPAVDKTGRSGTVGVDSGAVRVVDKFDLGTVHSKPASAQTAKDLEAPKNAVEVKKEKNGKADAVRRPIDAEHRIANNKSFSPSERRKKLEERLEGKARKGGNTFDGDLDAEEIAAFTATQYRIRDRKCLTGGFVYLVWEAYDDHKDNLPLPGILCSKIIDRCMSEQESCKKLRIDPSEYYWPPDFQEHRDKLRAQERGTEETRPTMGSAAGPSPRSVKCP